MFTGLITDIGTVEQLIPGGVTDVWIRSNHAGFELGESIACDGVCLTVVEFHGSRFRVQAAPETLRRSTLGSWNPGSRINLERALRMGDRLGGHWVQGHVDGVSTVVSTRNEGGSLVVTISLPGDMARYLVVKGSICVDGVSLTLTAVDASVFSVMLIPQTQTQTTLGAKRAGDGVNLEVDVIGKYVARNMELMRP